MNQSLVQKKSFPHQPHFQPGLAALPYSHLKGRLHLNLLFVLSHIAGLKFSNPVASKLESPWQHSQRCTLEPAARRRQLHNTNRRLSAFRFY